MKLFRATERFHLPLLLIFAFALRFVRCGQYLDADELINFRNVHHFFHDRTILPYEKLYPTLYSYLMALPTMAGALLLRAVGWLSTVNDITALTTIDSRLPVLPGRLLSALLGTATIFAVFRVGERNYGRAAGLFAGLFLTVSDLHAKLSAYALADATTAFFAVLSLGYALRAAQREQLKDFLLASFFAGLATSTKYNAALTCVPVMCAYAATLYRRGALFRAGEWTRALGCAGTFVGAVILGSPAWLLRPDFMASGFRYNFGVVNSGGHTMFYSKPFVDLLRFGWQEEHLLFGLYLLSFAFLLFRPNSREWIICSGLLLPFLYVGTWRYQSFHYLLYTFPAAALGIGRGCNLCLAFASRWQPRWALSFAMGALALLLAAGSIIQALPFFLPDSRYVAQAWINQNVPEGSRIVMDPMYVPRLLDEELKTMLAGKHRGVYDRYLKEERSYRLSEIQMDTEWLTGVPADYLVISSDWYARYLRAEPPASGGPRFAELTRARVMYQALVNDGRGCGWKLAESVWTGNGPRLLIYSRET